MDNRCTIIMENPKSKIQNPKLKFNQGKNAAFTLIELLVVVAIIALLVSILLPSLNRAKELARRVICASNMHHVVLAYGLYANEYNDCLPVGYWSTKQYNYHLAWGGDPPGYTVFGYLYHAGLMEQPEAFHCPAYPMLFDAPVGSPCCLSGNPWPPGEGTTRAGYGSRPEVNWCGPGGVIVCPDPFPRLSTLFSKALVADFASVPVHLEERHKDGLNVGYGDGSACWVDRALFAEPLDSIDVSLTEGGFSSIFDDDIDEIWEVFDERH